MKRLSLTALLAAASLSTAWAQPAVFEYCTANSQEAAVAEATAMLIPKTAVVLNPDNVTYTITSAPFTFAPDSPDAICPSEPYYAQAHPLRGRTAFFVGADLMVTAPHAPQATFDPANFAIVFGLRATNSGGVCTQPDLNHVPKANVYFTAPSNWYVHYQPGSGNPVFNDYLLFKLDRPVTGALPLPLRRTGGPDAGDPLFVAGHGNWLTLKIARDAHVRSVQPEGLELSGVPAYLGYSGAPVFDPKTELVEAAIAGGSYDGPALLWDPVNLCMRTQSRPASSYLWLNNGNIAEFAAYVPVPPTELQLSPGTTSVHVAPVGGALTNPVSTFSIAPPPTATGTLTFKVSMPLILPNGPSLSMSPPAGNYSLAPGSQPLQFTVTAGMGGITGCRVYDTSIGALPLNHAGFGKRARHRFEVGMSSFTVSPAQVRAVSELGAPYPSHTIEIANPYSQPSPVSVTPQAPWVRVNGAASATLNLAPAGSPGDRATVVLTFDDGAAGFPVQSETKTVDVVVATTTQACSLRQPHTIPVTLTRGIERFVGRNLSNGDGALPKPSAGQTFGAPFDIEIPVAGEAAFTVDDVDLAVGFENFSSPFNLDASQADTKIKLELIAPDGTSSVLWDRNDAPAAYLVDDAISNDPNEISLLAIKLDPSTTPPLGPGSLNAFIGVPGNGTWRLRLWSSEPVAPIIPFHASLRITKKRHASLYTYNTVIDYLPPPASGQTFGAPGDLFVDLSADAAFAVNDVDLKLGFYPNPPFLNLPDLDTLLRVELTSPSNTTSVLWDRDNATGGYVGAENIDWLGSTVGVATLQLDTTTTPPLGGGTLTTFNGQNGAGIWRVRLLTTDPSQRILPSHVNLLIGR